VRLEELCQGAVGHAVGQVAYVQLLAHVGPPKKEKTGSPRPRLGAAAHPETQFTWDRRRVESKMTRPYTIHEAHVPDQSNIFRGLQTGLPRRNREFLGKFIREERDGVVGRARFHVWAGEETSGSSWPFLLRIAEITQGQAA